MTKVNKEKGLIYYKKLNEIKGKDGQVVLDQIRAVDRARLVKKLGRLDATTSAAVLDVLQELFHREINPSGRWASRRHFKQFRQI